MRYGWVVVVSTMFAGGCRNGAPQLTHPPPVRTEIAAPQAPAGPSLYPLKLGLHDQEDRPTTVDVGRGHPVIMTMFYGSCGGACPLIISRIQHLEAELAPSARAETRVLLVSFDPARDTPEVLRSVAARHHADLARWTFATGPDEDVRTLAAALAISYRKLPDGSFIHDSAIVALGRDGRVLARVDGIGDLSPLVAAVAREVEGSD